MMPAIRLANRNSMRLRTVSAWAIASSHRPRANRASQALFRFIAPRRRSSPEASLSAIALSNSSRDSSLRPTLSSRCPRFNMAKFLNCEGDRLRFVHELLTSAARIAETLSPSPE